MAFCKYCGKAVRDEAQFCAFCGGERTGKAAAVPVVSAEMSDGGDVVSTPALTTNEARKKTMSGGAKTAIVVTTVIVVLAVVALAIFLLMQGIEKKNTQTYIEDLNKTYSSLNITFDDLFELANTTSDVMTGAYGVEPSNESSKQYIVLGDVKASIEKLHADNAVKEKLKWIDTCIFCYETNLEKVKNPPEEYERAYKLLTLCYDDCVKLFEAVKEPGSDFSAYIDNFSKYGKSIIERQMQLDSIMPHIEDDKK